MCGISGFNWGNDALIKEMNIRLKHRGPDSEGIFPGGRVTLGHMRLAVIDLTENGKQPMVYKHKGKEVVIIHNGEVYNFQRIRHTLEKLNYKFKSTTDTEVILASYLQWGTDCVTKFNGMWAFAIYDKQKELLFLSRDRLGQKPLYYYFDGEKFIFSSELKGILAHELKLSINSDAVDMFLYFGFIPSPVTIYNEIFKLEPRQNLIFDLKSSKIMKYQYYKIPIYAPVHNKKYLIKQTKSLLKDATGLRLISDVLVGAFLSGGLDSSYVVSEIVKVLPPNRLNTFSIGFEGKYDERKYMNLVKNKFKTNHHEYYFKNKDFQELLDKFVQIYDEPFSDPSAFPSLKICSMAKEQITVALSGDGGDEMFAGYGNHRLYYKIYRLQRYLPKSIFNLINVLLPNFKGLNSIKKGLSVLSKKNDLVTYLQISQRDFFPKVVEKYLRERFNSVYERTGNLPETISRLDLFYLTTGDNYLHKMDKASMAYGLEVRSPFLDYRFIELSAKIPLKFKFSLFTTKRFIRNILRGILPEIIIKKKKQGFSPPLLEFMRLGGFRDIIKPKFKKMLGDKILNTMQQDLFNAVIKNHKKGYDKQLNYYWRFVVLALWYERWGGFKS